MKKLIFPGLLFTAILLLTTETGSAQPWSVAPTNSAPPPPPTVQNWSNIATAATPLSPPPQLNVPPHPVHPVPPPQAAPPQISNVPLPAGILAFDAEQKEYTAKPGEPNGSFVFNVTNISSGEVAITFVQTSCGCTTAKIQLPLKLAPAATAEIPINMSLAGKSGVVIKSVTIHTDKGHKVLMVKSTIQAPAPNTAAEAMNRERNQQLAMQDRQAVFKGDCAKCHVEPVIGKTGKELFTAACGICHEAEHRATMVQDLHQLKVTPNAEYWKFFIANGKPATLMPAFSQTQGGPLSEAQINSLVEYLVKDFPASKTNAVSHASAH
jgi:mono/diheme cytochrome c family protein